MAVLIRHVDAACSLRPHSRMFAEHRTAAAINVRELLASDGPLN